VASSRRLQRTGEKSTKETETKRKKETKEKRRRKEKKRVITGKIARCYPMIHRQEFHD
jgi:hypothetical protein